MSHDSKILPVAYRTELGGYRVRVQTGYPSVESFDYNLVHPRGSWWPSIENDFLGKEIIIIITIRVSAVIF